MSGRAAEPPHPLTASPLVLTASLPKQKHSRPKSRQLRRLVCMHIVYYVLDSPVLIIDYSFNCPTI